MSFALVTYRDRTETRLGIQVQPPVGGNEAIPPHPAAKVLAPPELKRWPTMPAFWAASRSDALSPMRKLEAILISHFDARSRIMPGAGLRQCSL